MTVILPNGVRHLFFHPPKVLSIFSRAASQLICGIVHNFKSKVIRSNVKLLERQFKDPPQAILSLQYFFLPFESILVLIGSF